MFRVAFKGVLARKLRLILTSIAVVLGVGFVSGAFFLTDSMRESFDNLFTQAVEGIDVQVQTKEYKEILERQATSGTAVVSLDLARVGMPEEAVTRVRDLPGVQRASGSIFESGVLILDKDGEPIGSGGAPSFGANWIPEAAEMGALRISEGDAPEQGEVLLDATTIKNGKYEVGDDVTVLFQGGRKTEEFEISGVVKFGDSNNLNGAAITVFETKQIQGLLDMGDRYTALEVQADEGVTQVTLKRTVAQALGAEYDVITGAESATEQSEAIDRGFLNILQNVILGFAAVAVFVGAFTIFNTFTILVGQRTREFGLLRAIGASRRQVLGIVVLEAVLTGIVASTLGILAGYGIAGVLRGMINTVFDGGIPNDAFPLTQRTVLVSYAVGVIVTLVASLLPAWRAARLSPLEALRANPAHAGRGWKSPVAGSILLLIGGALVIWGFNPGDDASTQMVLGLIGGGFAIAIVGIALLSRLFIVPITRLLSTVLARGTTGELATRNVLRNRARSATTASALMIGLALASLVLVFQASLGATVDRQIDDILGADITVYNSTALQTGVGVVEDDAVERMREVDGVDQVAGQRYGGAAIGDDFDPGGDVKSIVAFDAGALEAGGLVELDVDRGSSEPGDGILIDADLARDEGLAVGDEIELAFSTDMSRSLEVTGIYEPNEIVGSQLITSIATFDELQPENVRAASGVFLSVDEGVKPTTVVERIKDELGRDANFLEILDTEALRDTFNDQLAPILGLVLGMLSLSLVIALFGIGNTMALNVFERTREIGLLRAVGGTRGQLRRIIRVEAVLVALFGAIVGVIVGVGAGRALIGALEDEGFVFAMDPFTLLLVLIGGFLAGLLASVLPARRAARTDVLAAIATE
jgi:putative ABC transport system permease protein